MVLHCSLLGRTWKAPSWNTIGKAWCERPDHSQELWEIHKWLVVQSPITNINKTKITIWSRNRGGEGWNSFQWTIWPFTFTCIHPWARWSWSSSPSAHVQHNSDAQHPLRRRLRRKEVPAFNSNNCGIQLMCWHTECGGKSGLNSKALGIRIPEGRVTKLHHSGGPETSISNSFPLLSCYTPQHNGPLLFPHFFCAGKHSSFYAIHPRQSQITKTDLSG